MHEDSEMSFTSIPILQMLETTRAKTFLPKLGSPNVQEQQRRHSCTASMLQKANLKTIRTTGTVGPLKHHQKTGIWAWG